MVTSDQPGEPGRNSEHSDVVRPTAWFRGEGGAEIEMDLPPPEGIAARVLAGAITQIDGPGGRRVREDDAPRDKVPASEPAPAPTPGASRRPAVNESKDAWVGYVVSLDVPGLDYEVVSGMTKSDLVERFGPRAGEPE